MAASIAMMDQIETFPRKKLAKTPAATVERKKLRKNNLMREDAKICGEITFTHLVIAVLEVKSSNERIATAAQRALIGSW